jgi:hypothetical protein
MYESQKYSEVCERLKITKAPELTSADEELNILYNKKNITMFFRVTCEMATPWKIIVDLEFASVNNDFSRGGHFT